jgi:serine/threonine protein kinase
MLLGKQITNCFTEADSQCNFFREIEVMMACDDPIVVRFHGFAFRTIATGTGELHICPMVITDFYSEGRLTNWLCCRRAPAGWDDAARSKVINGVAAGMARLHSRHGIHRNLKIGNVWLDRNFEGSVAHFGLSKLVVDQREAITHSACAMESGCSG